MFRFQMPTLCAAIHILSAVALAHGPQVQITVDNSQITTRRLILDGPYSESLTAPKAVYVMPVEQLGGVEYSHPNYAVNPITMLPAFPSGPGLTYGFDLADGGPQLFEAGSLLSVGFVDRLRIWNGATHMFDDAGDTQLKAFRGSNPDIASPSEDFAATSDVGPFDSLSLPMVADGYGASGTEAHSSLRFALLGDGLTASSASPDGVYLLTLQVSSSQIGLMPSDPYYFVLAKNAADTDVLSAVRSLNIADGLVQYVPETGSLGLAMLALVGVLRSGRGLAGRMRGPR